MCGITGIVTNDTAIPPDVIEQMTGRLRHRGPDAHACVQLAGCQLGHTRLSIIDLVSGDQPMSDETGRYWITFNGEIYNYRELRSALKARGWKFRTESDTEVLLCAYQDFGESVTEHLNGQFAFAIWDNQDRRVFGARDRLGEKPLYWANSWDGRYFLFASEIKSLLASGLIRPKIDPVSVDVYFSLNYVSPERTVYENIHTILPGHAFRWQDGRLETWAYWEPTFSHHHMDPQEAVEQLRFLIKQAVERQMVADVPVGAFLSGGLDSGTIVALMAQQTDHPVMTFSVGFGDLIDELPYARDVAQRYHTDHYELQMNIPVGELLERMAEVYDEPFADSSNIPTYLIAGFARQHVKVVLSGDGGDELFGGYSWYKLPLQDYPVRFGAPGYLAAWTWALGWRALSKVGMPVVAWRDAAVKHMLRARDRYRFTDPWARHLHTATWIDADRSTLWGDSALSARTKAAIQGQYLPSDGVSGMDRVVGFDVRCYLPGDILVKVDRASMAHGLETRAPFLDVDLVEFVWGLPWQLRFQDHENLKYLLRAACRDLWPESLHNRPKQGFGAPVHNWIQRADVQSLLQRVTSPGSPLDALLSGSRTGLSRLDAYQQWTVLCLGLWMEKRPECLS